MKLALTSLIAAVAAWFAYNAAHAWATIQVQGNIDALGENLKSLSPDDPRYEMVMNLLLSSHATAGAETLWVALAAAALAAVAGAVAGYVLSLLALAPLEARLARSRTRTRAARLDRTAYVWR